MTRMGEDPPLWSDVLLSGMMPVNRIQIPLSILFGATTGVAGSIGEAIADGTAWPWLDWIKIGLMYGALFGWLGSILLQAALTHKPMMKSVALVWGPLHVMAFGFGYWNPIALFLGVPIAFVFLVGVVSAILPDLPARRNCLSCKYDLTGLPETVCQCPECGSPITSGLQRPPSLFEQMEAPRKRIDAWVDRRIATRSKSATEPHQDPTSEHE